jgi:HK97 family phage prohead protease
MTLFAMYSPAADAPVAESSRFDVQLERAQFKPGEKRRIRGVANTYRVMRSGRIIHPDAVQNLNARIPLMAQHGLIGGGFATIGTVERMRSDRNGLYFEATLAEGTDLADQAATLIEQGHLAAISIGWTVKEARLVRKRDADLDAHVKEKMQEADVDEAILFRRIELAEISLVDVADDPDAKLAAGSVRAELDRLWDAVRFQKHEIRIAFAEGADKVVGFMINRLVELTSRAGSIEDLDVLVEALRESAHEDLRRAAREIDANVAKELGVD